ncbi:MAG: hypothetical protein HY843_07200 [Bdellovibrio sp.]|nr:hypothetical protein [Bdellovibrio sp.]
MKDSKMKNLKDVYFKLKTAPTKKLRKVKLNLFKTSWKEKTEPVWNFICPTCKAQRMIIGGPRPKQKHYVQVGLTSAVFTLLTWPVFSWKGLVSFIPFWMVFEIFYRIKIRALVGCPHCGFDPYLFLSHEEKAKQQMKDHLEKKYEKILAKKPEPPATS